MAKLTIVPGQEIQVDPNTVAWYVTPMANTLITLRVIEVVPVGALSSLPARHVERWGNALTERVSCVDGRGMPWEFYVIEDVTTISFA
jgi:hypothetical protein